MRFSGISCNQLEKSKWLAYKKIYFPKMEFMISSPDEHSIAMCECIITLAHLIYILFFAFLFNVFISLFYSEIFSIFCMFAYVDGIICEFYSRVGENLKKKMFILICYIFVTIWLVQIYERMQLWK